MTKLQYITPTILTDLICELWSLKAEIWLNHWAPERGITIMDVVRREARDAEQMAELNMCRTWLRVHYVSDLTTVDGRNIHPGYVAGRRVHDSEWNWTQWDPLANSCST